jgi:hypothetical protein
MAAKPRSAGSVAQPTWHWHPANDPKKIQEKLAFQNLGLALLFIEWHRQDVLAVTLLKRKQLPKFAGLVV